MGMLSDMRADFRGCYPHFAHLLPWDGSPATQSAHDKYLARLSGVTLPPPFFLAVFRVCAEGEEGVWTAEKEMVGRWLGIG